MEKRRTRWPWETRVKLVAIYEEMRRRNKGYSAREFSRYTDVPYSAFCAGSLVGEGKVVWPFWMFPAPCRAQASWMQLLAA